MPVVKKYLVKVLELESSVPGIYSVSFVSEKKEFKFKPGQFLHLTLDDYDPSKGWPESRCFSMQTSPNEKFIKITFTVKGKYTTRMVNELKIGKKFWVKLPYGNLFTQIHSLKNCVFIAGGTGITPFLSLFTDDSFKKYINPLLYFGAKSEQYNIYNNALEQAKLINPNFLIKTVYENSDGMLNIEKIYTNEREKIYFISGPPLMIKNFKNHLLKKGVNDYKIITDDWE